MTAQEAINFIHRRSWRASKPGLSRTRQLLELMGNPEKKLKFVHVAGTNGKGSTSALLSSVLAAAGFKTGLYASPYISSFNERMQVNGKNISGELLSEITEKIAPFALSMEDAPTEFEIVTAIAMEFFLRSGCDLVVLETGLGGRLDSTNIIENPLLSIITNIGLDHTRELGDTVEQIAAEKAGIIKPGRPVVIYDLPACVRAVIANRCAETQSPLISSDFGRIEQISDSRDGQVFSYKEYESLFLPLLGAHQLKNAAVALEALTLLRGEGYNISDTEVARGFENTRWPARFEIICDKPFAVVDGGHNPQCAETVAENLRRYFPRMKTVLLYGVLAGKDYMSMAKTLSAAADCFVTITPPHPMAKPAAELSQELGQFGKDVFTCGSITEGIERALELAGDRGVVCAVGSLYSAGEIRAYFGL